MKGYTEWTRRVWLVALAASLPGVAGSGLAGAAPAAKAPASAAPANAAVAAEVNNEKIMVSDVERMLGAIKEQTPTLAGTSAADKAALESWRQRVLESLIFNRLLYQEAVHRNIRPAPGAVDKLMVEYKTAHGFKDDGELTQALAKEGLTVAHVRQNLTEELMFEELGAQMAADVTIAPTDISTYYQAHPIKIPDHVQVSHILIEVKPDASAGDKKKAQERAHSVLQQAVGGADFAQLAQQNSDDPTSKNQGGLLDPTLDLGALGKAFKDAVAANPSGKVVGQVITTQFGYHILKTEKIAGRTVPFAEVNDETKGYLKNYLLKKKVQDRLDQRVAELRAQAKIKKYI